MSAICNLVTVFCNWAKTDCISNDCSNLLPIAANWFDNSFTGDPQNKSSTYSKDFTSKYSKIEVWVFKESKRLISSSPMILLVSKKSQLNINFTFCESSTCWAEAALASFKVFHSWRLCHVDSSWFILYIFLLDLVRHCTATGYQVLRPGLPSFHVSKIPTLPIPVLTVRHLVPHWQIRHWKIPKDSKLWKSFSAIHRQPRLFFWSSSLFFTFFFFTWSRWT